MGAEDYTLAERIADLLVGVEKAASADLAKQLGVSKEEVRKELRRLEKLGIVYRTGQTRGTRWHLG